MAVLKTTTSKSISTTGLCPADKKTAHDRFSNSKYLVDQFRAAPYLTWFGHLKLCFETAGYFKMVKLDFTPGHSALPNQTKTKHFNTEMF